jgi:hypothetical protein
VKVKGALLTGVAVHPKFRRRGIFSALVNACEQEAWRQEAAFVATMPNEKSRPGFLKLGYADLGRRQLLMRPLSPASFGGRVFPVLGHLAGSVGGLVQAAAKPLPRGPHASVREIDRTPGDIETLAPAHENRFPGLRIRRTAEWLGWRLTELAPRHYRQFETRRPDGRLAGFAAITLDERDAMKVCYLLDLLVEDETTIPTLLATICNAARAEKAEALATVVSGGPLAKCLRRAGMWAVPEWLPLKKFYSVARFNPRMDLPARWRRLAGWYQTLADWDNL